VSVESAALFSGRTSILAFVDLGSSLSVSSFARLGSCLCVAQPSLGNNLSIMSEALFRSCVSVNSFGRLGSSLSIFGRTMLGGICFGERFVWQQFIGPIFHYYNAFSVESILSAIHEFSLQVSMGSL
jgi:hypothetical protein